MKRQLIPVLLTGVLGVVMACRNSASPPQYPKPLSADSAALLRTALQLARPAYVSQQEALRAGIYQDAPAPTPARDDRLPGEIRREGGYVIQIAGFNDRLSAERAAAEAER